MSANARVVLITGAGAGLGRSHALLLAKNGYRVVVNDLDAAVANTVADEIVSLGGEAIGFGTSVSDEKGVTGMVEQVIDRWGRIDGLVNNAGILRDKSFAKMSLDAFRQVVDVHLMGAVICTKAVWDIMREQAYGRIVMTTSSSGLYGNFGQSNYGAAKMALVGLMQTLAIEGRKYNVHVNCLAPTAATSMTQGVLPDDVLNKIKPEFVSPGLLPLLSDDAPTRAILCAGAGHFATAHVTLTKGKYLGDETQACAAIFDDWAEITNRSTGEIVPSYGFTQSEREVQSVLDFANQ